MISSHRKREKRHEKLSKFGKWPAIATITGTIIGAGFLGIPYVVEKSGFLMGAEYIVAIGLIMLLVNLYFSEVILRTKKVHQIPGYAGKYSGKTGEIMSFIALFFGMYAATIAYILAEGESLSFLFFGHTSYALLFGTLFFGLIAYLNHRGLKALKKYEFVGFIIIILIVLLIFIIYSPSIDFENLKGFNKKFMFLPFGVILFAYLGIEALTEAKMILGKNNKELKKVAIISSIIPIIFYIIFSFVVVGAFSFVPEIATLALGKIFVFLGILTIFTAAFSVSMILKDSYVFDMGLNKKLAWVFSIVPPYILFLIIMKFKLLGFIGLLGLGGSITGGFLVILILLISKKAKTAGDRKPEFSIPINWFIIIVLSLIFISGIVYALWSVFV